MDSAPSKYPATEENTTLTESLSLVISVKFLITDCGIDCDWIIDKLLFLSEAKIRFLYFFSQYIINNLMLLFQHFH